MSTIDTQVSAHTAERGRCCAVALFKPAVKPMRDRTSAFLVSLLAFGANRGTWPNGKQTTGEGVRKFVLFAGLSGARYFSSCQRLQREGEA